MKRLLDGDFWLGVRHFAPAHTAAIIGVAASVAVWYLAFSTEHRAMVDEFYARANNQTITMENGIDNYWDELYAVRALLESLNQNVTREEFENFSRSLISHQSRWRQRISIFRAA